MNLEYFIQELRIRLTPSMKRKIEIHHEWAIKRLDLIDKDLALMQDNPAKVERVKELKKKSDDIRLHVETTTKQFLDEIQSRHGVEQ